MVDAPMNKGDNSQPEAMFSVRYHKYRFESCPDYKYGYTYGRGKLGVTARLMAPLVGLGSSPNVSTKKT